MDLIRVHKAGDELILTLSAELIEAQRLAEDDVLAVQQVGEEIILRRAAPKASNLNNPNNSPFRQ